MAGSLARVLDRFELTIRRFAHRAEPTKPTMWLKLRALTAMGPEPVLVLDGDTCVQRRIELPSLAPGQVGAVRDRRDGTPPPSDPWHVPGRPYINSGVLLLGRETEDLRARCLDLAATPEAALGRYADQRVWNYLLQSEAAERLVLLPPKLNAIRWRMPRRAVIQHFAGGARQAARHAKACQRVLG
ncbi:MAG: hypothetical protein GY898_05540 [Proteobacteria bacterium]|nr:hypothetical protein [Pseudomonadota bacterium]